MNNTFLWLKRLNFFCVFFFSRKYLNDKKGGLEESVDDDTGSDSSDTGKNKRSAFKYTSSQTYTINELMSGIIPLGTRLMKKARRMSR